MRVFLRAVILFAYCAASSANSEAEPNNLPLLDTGSGVVNTYQ